MAWKPWYERMAEIDSAEARAEFAAGVFGAPTPKSMTPSQAAGMALVAIMSGIAGAKIAKARKR